MAKDITGNIYGDLVALSILEKSPNGDYYWACQCSCGNTFKTTIGRLNFGKATSCGCKTSSKMVLAKTTHGMSKTKQYKSWTKIKERIFDKNCKDYPEYGGRGLIMQESWVNSFDEFYKHIGDIPDGKYSVDRILSNVGYVEGNVRWANDNTQARNRRILKNNSSGKTGVLWDVKYDKNGVPNLYAKTIWRDLQGVGRNKVFSVKTYGLLPAFTKACEYRDYVIKQLNDMGAGYSVQHGN